MFATVEAKSKHLARLFIAVSVVWSATRTVLITKLKMDGSVRVVNVMSANLSDDSYNSTNSIRATIVISQEQKLTFRLN